MAILDIAIFDMAIYCLILLSGVFCFALCLMTASSAVPKPAFSAQQFSFLAEDDDMKVVPALGSKHDKQDKLEPSQEEIEHYFRHKSCGNLDRARKLGKQLGEEILSFSPDSGELTFTQQECTHAKILYWFVSEDCVRSTVPDPILLKLVLAQIDDTISEQLPSFYSSFYQYRSYTVYKMCVQEECHSSLEHTAQEIGKCWAQMVGRQKDTAFCVAGAQFYLDMKRRCEQLVANAAFVSL